MLRLVEMADGSYLLTIEISKPPFQYREEFRFVKVDDDEAIPEKEGGFKLELVD